jgi:hypothetical protein
MTPKLIQIWLEVEKVALAAGRKRAEQPFMGDDEICEAALDAARTVLQDNALDLSDPEWDANVPAQKPSPPLRSPQSQPQWEITWIDGWKAGWEGKEYSSPILERGFLISAWNTAQKVATEIRSIT